jgi:SPFH domain/Band 7 family protein
MRKAALILAALVGCATLAGCAVADPDTSQAVLRYSGGWFSNQAWNKCILPGERDVTTPGMQHFYYPQGQRTLTLSDEPGADGPPLQVATNNQILLTVRGTITYRLNTNCDPYTEYKTAANGQRVVDREWPGGLFQRFHDTIGRHSLAYAETGGEPQPPGWNTVVARYVGDPLSKAANDIGKRYTWQDLYSNPAKNAEWQAAVIAALPQLVTAQAGADHFLIDNVQLLQPTLPPALNAELENNQAAGLRHNTADTDKATARDFPGGVSGYLEYLRQLAINDAIRSGKVRVIPVPAGSGVIVNGG